MPQKPIKKPASNNTYTASIKKKQSKVNDNATLKIAKTMTGVRRYNEGDSVVKMETKKYKKL